MAEATAESLPPERLRKHDGSELVEHAAGSHTAAIGEKCLFAHVHCWADVHIHSSTEYACFVGRNPNVVSSRHSPAQSHPGHTTLRKHTIHCPLLSFPPPHEKLPDARVSGSTAACGAGEGACGVGEGTGACGAGDGEGAGACGAGEGAGAGGAGEGEGTGAAAMATNPRKRARPVQHAGEAARLAKDTRHLGVPSSLRSRILAPDVLAGQHRNRKELRDALLTELGECVQSAANAARAASVAANVWLLGADEAVLQATDAAQLLKLYQAGVALARGSVVDKRVRRKLPAGAEAVISELVPRALGWLPHRSAEYLYDGLLANAILHVCKALPRAEEQYVRWRVRVAATAGTDAAPGLEEDDEDNGGGGGSDGDGDGNGGDDDDEEEDVTRTTTRDSDEVAAAMQCVPRIVQYVRGQCAWGDISWTRSLRAGGEVTVSDDVQTRIRVAVDALTAVRPRAKSAGAAADAMKNSIAIAAKTKDDAWKDAHPVQVATQLRNAVAKAYAAGEDASVFNWSAFKVQSFECAVRGGERGQKRTVPSRVVDVTVDYPGARQAFEAALQVASPLATAHWIEVKANGLEKYLGYLRWLQRQADTCCAEAAVAGAGTRRATMRRFCMLPIPRGGHALLRLDNDAAVEIARRVAPRLPRSSAAGADTIAHAGNGLVARSKDALHLLVGPPRPCNEPSPDDGWYFASVDTDGATVNYAYTRAGGLAKDQAFVCQNGDLHSGKFTNAQRKSQLQAREFPQAMLRMNCSDWRGIYGPENAGKALRDKVASGRLRWEDVDLVAADPGKESILYALRANMASILALDDAATDGGESAYCSDDLAAALIAQQDRATAFRLRDGAHGRLKGRHRGLRHDLKRREDTHMSCVLVAQSVLAQGRDGRGGGWRSPDVDVLRRLWRLEWKADGQLSPMPRGGGGGAGAGDGVVPLDLAQELAPVVGADASVQAMFDHYMQQVPALPAPPVQSQTGAKRTTAPPLREKPAPGSPAYILQEYRFGGGCCAARARRREAWTRRRHVAVSANKMIHPQSTASGAAQLQSRTQRVREMARTIWRREHGGQCAFEHARALRRMKARHRRELSGKLGLERSTLEAVHRMQVDARLALCAEEHMKRAACAKAARFAEGCGAREGSRCLRRPDGEDDDRRAQVGQDTEAEGAGADTADGDGPPSTSPRRIQVVQGAEGAGTGYRPLRVSRTTPARLQGRPGKLTVVLIGDASFAPGSRGYAPTSHRPIVAELARRRGVIVVMVDEFRSSCLCFACAARMKQVSSYN
jgi:hypothetical protein